MSGSLKKFLLIGLKASALVLRLEYSFLHIIDEGKSFSIINYRDITLRPSISIHYQ